MPRLPAVFSTGGRAAPASEFVEALSPITRARPRAHRWRIDPGWAIPAALLSLIVLAAVLAPVLAPYAPDKASLRDSLLPPSWLPDGQQAHLLGTDRQGRDILSRLIYGARLSLLIGVAGLQWLGHAYRKESPPE